jgi:hypothetical protein
MTLVLLTVICAYLTSARILSNEKTAEVWRILQISLSFMVCVAYWRNAMSCFLVVGKWPDKVSLIALGIVMSWASVCSNGLWGMFWRLSGQPGWMVNNDFYQSWVMFNCVAAGLHIISPNLLGHGVPNTDRARLAGAFGLAFVLIMAVSVLKPDMAPLSEALRPYLESRRRHGLPAERGPCALVAFPGIEDGSAGDGVGRVTLPSWAFPP